MLIGRVFSHCVLSMTMSYCVAPETPVHPKRTIFPNVSTTLRFVTRPTDCSTKHNPTKFKTDTRGHSHKQKHAIKRLRLNKHQTVTQYYKNKISVYSLKTPNQNNVKNTVLRELSQSSLPATVLLISDY